jgi:hypothetical protein
MDMTTKVRFPEEAGILLSAITERLLLPVSYSMSSGASLKWDKRPKCEADQFSPPNINIKFYSNKTTYK